MVKTFSIEAMMKLLDNLRLLREWKLPLFGVSLSAWIEGSLPQIIRYGLFRASLARIALARQNRATFFKLRFDGCSKAFGLTGGALLRCHHNLFKRKIKDMTLIAQKTEKYCLIACNPEKVNAGLCDCLNRITEAGNAVKPMLPAVDREYILCAAIWFDDGTEYAFQPKNITTGVVFCGHRHACIFQQIGGTVKERKELGIYEKEQGFLTNKNRFVTREEAAKIALTAGQIAMPLPRLFSEDLY